MKNTNIIKTIYSLYFVGIDETLYFGSIKKASEYGDGLYEYWSKKNCENKDIIICEMQSLDGGKFEIIGCYKYYKNKVFKRY